MKQKQSGSGPSTGSGGTPQVLEISGAGSEFDGEKLWIGRHAADQDTLVFDPAESAPAAERVSFYSLTQHRTRTFPRAVVLRQIHGLTDDISWHRARHDYDDRASRRQEHSEEAAAAQARVVEHQRQSVVEAHSRYLEGIGAENRGVTPTPAAHRPGRRSKCHVCGIGLDDFASSICVACNGVLCTCGGCACTLGGAGRSAQAGTS